MQEPEQITTTEQQEEPSVVDPSVITKQLAVFRKNRDDIMNMVVFATVVALLGVICGAINFVGPAVHYPTWLLVTWFVADLMLVVFFLAHIAIAFGVTVDFEKESDVVSYAVFMLIVVAISLIGTWILLANKHFAWLSLILFLLLSAFIVIDAWMLYKKQK